MKDWTIEEQEFANLYIEMVAIDITDEDITKIFMYAFHQTMNEIVLGECKIKEIDKRWMKNTRKIVEALKEGELEIDGTDIFNE